MYTNIIFVNHCYWFPWHNKGCELQQWTGWITEVNWENTLHLEKVKCTWTLLLCSPTRVLMSLCTYEIHVGRFFFFFLFCFFLMWGWNNLVGSVLGLLLCVMQHCRFNPAQSHPVGEFSFGGNTSSDSTPLNSLRWEYKLRSSLCTHAFHRIDSKDPDLHVFDEWMPATKTHPAHTINEDEMWLRVRLD